MLNLTLFTFSCLTDIGSLVQIIFIFFLCQQRYIWSLKLDLGARHVVFSDIDSHMVQLCGIVVVLW